MESETPEESSALRGAMVLSALTASMCCLPSVVWVLFAGSSAIVAANQMSNDLYYGIARPLLYLAALVMLGVGLTIHFRNRGICTLDEAKQERRRIINTSLAVLTVTILAYIIWNYVVLEIIGIALGLPWAETAIWR